MPNFSARFLRSTLGRLKEKYDWQDLKTYLFAGHSMIRNVSALEVLSNRALQIDNYLLTEALRADSQWKSAFLKRSTGSVWPKISGRRDRPPHTIFSCQKIR